jgi:hypothetical protein
MRQAAITLFVCSLILTNGCGKPAMTQPTPAPSESTAASPRPNNMNATPSASMSPVAKVKFDACMLLTSAEIQAVQGEPLKETNLSERTSGDFVTTQCYYALPTPSNSISLSLTLRDPRKPEGQSLKEFWEATFAKSEGKVREFGKDLDKGKNKTGPQNKSRREGEEEDSTPAEPVRGIGDEAFWSASRVGGALYVLKRDRFLRISVGGKGDVEAKLKKSKTLAEKALRRL